MTSSEYCGVSGPRVSGLGDSGARRGGDWALGWRRRCHRRCGRRVRVHWGRVHWSRGGTRGRRVLRLRGVRCWRERRGRERRACRAVVLRVLGCLGHVGSTSLSRASRRRTKSSMEASSRGGGPKIRKSTVAASFVDDDGHGGRDGGAIRVWAEPKSLREPPGRSRAQGGGGVPVGASSTVEPRTPLGGLRCGHDDWKGLGHERP